MQTEPGRTPFGINLAVGAVAMVTAAFAAVAVSHDVPVRLAIVAAILALFAAVLTDVRASLATALLGYLLFNGFLVHRFGELSWAGTAWQLHLTVFAAAVGLGLASRRIRNARAGAAVTAEIDAMLDAADRHPVDDATG